MRRFALLLTGILVMLILALGYTGLHAQKMETEQENMALKPVAAVLPRSLDALFPPVAEQPVFLFGMFGMATPFEGIIVDLFENDPENAQAQFERFKGQYAEVSKLVPEWEEQFPMAPVEGLGAALGSGDLGQVMGAMGNVGKVCGDCHAANMVQVQHRYHWGDFHAIAIQDPLTNEEVEFSQFMQFLSGNFTGIGVDLEEGQPENAQMQFQGFNARFQALKNACKECHDTDRKYYVDESVQASIDALGQALSASSIDPGAVGALSQKIGGESCGGCHLVHIPAAFAQAQYRLTPVEEEIAYSYPTRFGLGQNYPNPFNPVTTIEYQVPVDGRVELKVYNILGQEVATLEDVFKQAGRYSVQWDATGMSSGVYLYQIFAGGYTETRKSVVLK